MDIINTGVCKIVSNSERAEILARVAVGYFLPNPVLRCTFDEVSGNSLCAKFLLDHFILSYLGDKKPQIYQFFAFGILYCH